MPFFFLLSIVKKHDDRLNLLVGMQPNISCNAQKVVPAVAFLRSSGTFISIYIPFKSLRAQSNSPVKSDRAQSNTLYSASNQSYSPYLFCILHATIYSKLNLNLSYLPTYSQHITSTYLLSTHPVLPPILILITVVHHMRQSYVDNFPTELLAPQQSLDTWMRSFLYFINDPAALARGEVPGCWREAVAQGLI